MIWDFIRDFFVQYIFGGFTSTGEAFGGFVGRITTSSFDYDSSGVIDIFVPIGTVINDNEYTWTDVSYITLGDWLSTTATIICMVLISICFILLIRWIFKAVTSAFLLK